LGESLVLVSLDYEKLFLIFSFSSENTIVAVLLQNNVEGHEQPIAVFSKELRDVEIKYTNVEKKAYDLVKTLKYFKDYILHSEIISYVPYSSIKDILV
jgi:hypothetical protein